MAGIEQSARSEERCHKQESSAGKGMRQPTLPPDWLPPTSLRCSLSHTPNANVEHTRHAHTPSQCHNSSADVDVIVPLPLGVVQLQQLPPAPTRLDAPRGLHLKVKLNLGGGEGEGDSATEAQPGGREAEGRDWRMGAPPTLALTTLGGLISEGAVPEGCAAGGLCEEEVEEEEGSSPLGRPAEVLSWISPAPPSHEATQEEADEEEEEEEAGKALSLRLRT